MGEDAFGEIWRVVKLLILLSNGNARVESGFTVNADVLCENQKEFSLISQRRCYDSILPPVVH